MVGNTLWIWSPSWPFRNNLGHLQQHLTCLVQSAKVIFYVDNCCNSRQKIQEVWPEAIVKLDHFHWLKHWDALLIDPYCEQAHMFRAYMAPAVLVIPNDLYNRKRHKMETRVRQPTGVFEAL